MSLLTDLELFFDNSRITKEQIRAYERLQKHLLQTMPEYTPVPDGYCDWILWTDENIGPHINDLVAVILKDNRNHVSYGKAQEYDWDGGLIVAYSIKQA